MWRPEHDALLASRMAERSQDAHNEWSAPALLEETPKALRVAVVEDDPGIKKLIIAEISDEWHAWICFGPPEDFLDEADSDRFDLLLLNLILPGMDGLACLKQLQLQAASQPALRVVIVTALNDADKKHSSGEWSGGLRAQAGSVSTAAATAPEAFDGLSFRFKLTIVVVPCNESCWWSSSVPSHPLTSSRAKESPRPGPSTLAIPFARACPGKTVPTSVPDSPKPKERQGSDWRTPGCNGRARHSRQG